MDITLGEAASRQVALLARAWNIDAEAVVLRLLEHFQREGGPELAEQTEDKLVAVHARYMGHRIAGKFDPETHSLVILSGPGKGCYKTPSGAATSAVQACNPGTTPHRNGWSFWVVDATGARLQSLRERPNRQTSL